MSNFRSDYFFIFTFSLLLATFSCSTKKDKRPSPLTIDSTVVSGTHLKIVYSSPAVRDRKIWDGLVPFDTIWRTGANAATYLSTSMDIKIAGKNLPKGKYSIFTIPKDTNWTIIFNKEWDQWGSYNYNADLDIFRLSINPKKIDFQERMTFKFIESQLVFSWENLSYSLPIEIQ